MIADQEGSGPGSLPRGAGQMVLEPAEPVRMPAEQVQNLYRLSDPALSELGLEELLEELLDRVREVLAVDTVAILLLDDAKQQLVARAARGIEEEVEQGVRIPIGRGFAGRIAAERVAIFIPDVDHADILNPILREKRIRSMLGIPLVVEGEIIGVLHVGSLRPRTFGSRDLAVLQLAAARAAPGIERARLYSELEREHHVAMVLQRSLLPKRLVATVGVDVAARYLPARAEVGGDWYDVIELPRGLLGVAIGDVVGHGLRAAALMGQLRTALQSYAMEGHRPGRTLELVDRFLRAISEPSMATAAYAVIDPETGTLQFASAGHLPPLVVGSDGVRSLDLPTGAPLGAFPYSTCPEHEVAIGSGEMVALYTDGLVERRGTPLSEGIETLASLLRGTSTPEGACRAAVDALVPPEGLSDDIAIVVLQNKAIPIELRLSLAADPQVLAQVRRMLRRWLHDRGVPEELVSEVTLAVNEACANAIEHAYSPAPAAFNLEGRLVDSELVLSVRDTGRWRPPRGHNRGRGLTIIEAAMDDVTVTPGDSGTEIVMRRRLGPR